MGFALPTRSGCSGLRPAVCLAAILAGHAVQWAAPDCVMYVGVLAARFSINVSIHMPGVVALRVMALFCMRLLDALMNEVWSVVGPSHGRSVGVCPLRGDSRGASRRVHKNMSAL